MFTRVSFSHAAHTAHRTSQTLDATTLLTRLYEFCTLSGGDLVLFVLHCVDVDETVDMPTPAVLFKKVMALLHSVSRCCCYAGSLKGAIDPPLTLH